MLGFIFTAYIDIYILIIDINKCYNGEKPVIPNTMQKNIPKYIIYNI